MDDKIWLAGQFEQHRDRLRALASRVLGSAAEADDAVQEAWIRLNRSDAEAVENLGAWLTTVVSRVCLNMLQARRNVPWAVEEEDLSSGSGVAAADGSGPEQVAVLADAVGLAVLVVLDNLTPPERVALVLHDMFAVPFDEIGLVLDRNATAARQLASRARRQVRAAVAGGGAARVRRARVVDDFVAAARRGDLESVVRLLHPQAVLRADDEAVRMGAPTEASGRRAILGIAGRARGMQPALVDGRPAAVWMPRGRLRVIFGFVVEGDAIAAIQLVAAPEKLERADVVLSGAEPDRPRR